MWEFIVLHMVYYITTIIDQKFFPLSEAIELRPFCINKFLRITFKLFFGNKS